MEFILTIIAFALIGGIARAGVLFVQHTQNKNITFKTFSNPDKHKHAFKKASLALQGFWIFCAVVITNQHESSLLSLDTFIMLIAITLPVSTTHIIKWLYSDIPWAYWVLLAGSIAQMLAYACLNDVFYGDEIIGLIVLMIFAFNSFYVCERFPYVWNGVCAYVENNYNAVKRNTIIAIVGLVVALIGYSMYQDYAVSKNTPSAEYFQKKKKKSMTSLDFSGKTRTTQPKQSVQKDHVKPDINLLEAIENKDVKPFLGEWRDGMATLTIKEIGSNKYEIDGIVLEENDPAPAIAGFTTTVDKSDLLQQTFQYKSDGGHCFVTLKFNIDKIYIKDNAGCGGMNARFNHELRKSHD